MMRRIKKGEEVYEAGQFVGDLHEEGKATWTCDSIPVWIKGEDIPYQDLIDDWKKQGVHDWIGSGRVHVIWTGGEPTLLKSQQEILNFLDYFKDTLYENDTPFGMFNEIETNGTGVLLPDFSNYISQINCSVKLENSGMERSRRIVPAALESILRHHNYWFKFVISNESDLEEIRNDFIDPFNIPPERIILMPGLDKREDFHERTQFSLEMGKKYGYIGLSRLHISGWDTACGV